MLMVWIGVVGFLVGLFVLLVPRARREDGYSPYYPPRRYEYSPRLDGCVAVVAVLLALAVLFVLLVIRWSMLMEAGF
jgi:heme/copper-type cytochrome/quinol oxidase subunit 2